MVYCDKEQEVSDVSFSVALRIIITNRCSEDYDVLPGNFPVNLHPNGNIENWRGYTGTNVKLRLFLKGKMQDIDLDHVHTGKCLDCIVPYYNPGITRHLCEDPIACSTVFPDSTDHVKMCYRPGERVKRNYPQLEDNYFS
jgi:hypothetical protein